MITNDDILEVNISSKHYNAAKKRAENFKGNKFTFSRNIDSTIAGFVAEEIFCNNFPSIKVSEENYNCDVIINGLGTIDIKTKRCKSRPRLDYDCSLSAYQAEKQKSDYLLFCRCDYDFKNLWILGIASKEQFLKKSKLIKAGERDGGFVCRTDMYNMKIEELDSFIEYVI